MPKLKTAVMKYILGLDIGIASVGWAVVATARGWIG